MRQRARQTNGVTMRFTQRETGQVQFTEQEFLNAISVATGGAARYPAGAKVTGVDVVRTGRGSFERGEFTEPAATITVRLVWESPGASDVAPEVSVITRELHQKLRGMTDQGGHPLFHPSVLLDGPDYFDGVPVRTVD